jgi:hypothetical protein
VCPKVRDGPSPKAGPGDIRIARVSIRFAESKGVAPRARFELATLRLTAEVDKNLSAASGVAYKKSGVIFPSLAAPNLAPNPMVPRDS